MGSERGFATPLAVPAANKPALSKIDHVWANTGEDKVTRDELRGSRDQHVINSTWDGRRIKLFGARNEVLSFNLVLEAAAETASGVEVSFSALAGSDGATIESRKTSGDGLLNFEGRNIELFYVRYLEVKGLSSAYEIYDERHVPERLRLPHDRSGRGQGNWEDRPDHNKLYPDIAVPLELHTPFSIDAQTNQSIWVDVFIPKSTPPGRYRGEVELRENGKLTWQLPVQLDVRNFTLPDLPSARTMLYVSRENINYRYLGKAYPDRVELTRQSRQIVDRHFQLAHRHKISLIDTYTPFRQMGDAWTDRLSGLLFTPERGYDGIGIGVGNNVYSIGTYGGWPWKKSDKAVFWTAADKWVQFFDSQKLTTPTDYFLYLIDESDDFPQIEKWSAWIDNNPGPGQRLRTMATIPLPKAVKRTPSLDIPTSTIRVGIPDQWQEARKKHLKDPKHQFYMYNGSRPASGSLAIEDDGVALRELAWGQYKMNIDRWFVWEGTYYDNYHGGLGETNVFRIAQTCCGNDGVDAVHGETGKGYSNGDGVLFYPGTDKAFPEESYGLAGPIASLRLKHWRRGLQDHDYLTMAANSDPQRVQEIIRKMIPKVLWEVGVSDPSDPTWVRTDISWPIDPDQWEAARKELADIIEKARTTLRN